MEERCAAADSDVQEARGPGLVALISCRGRWKDGRDPGQSVEGYDGVLGVYVR